MSQVLDVVPVEKGGELQQQSSVFLPVMTMDLALERREAVIEFTKRIMVADKDFGVIPGTGTKPTLLKPGAEKLCNFFGLEPECTTITEEMDWTGEKHRGEPFFYIRYKCRLLRQGVVLGVGEGSCNSWESKYRYREGKRVCPACGKDAIIKGKAEYGGGWLCFGKKGGCGQKFLEGAAEITGQSAGRVPNPDIADVVNTIQKMAWKRALVAATLIATSASDFFTQDVEDMPQFEQAPAPAPARTEAKPKAEAPKAAPRKVPEELMIPVDKLRKGDFSDVAMACTMLERECKDLGIGAAYTNRSVGLRASYPSRGKPDSKPIPPDVMEGFLLDVWGEIEAMRLRRAGDTPEPKAVDLDDKSDWLPEGV